MEKSTTNSKDKIENITSLHRDKLGLEIPNGFFSKSKSEILNTISQDKEKSQTLFNLQRRYFYPIAASIIFLIGITLWLTNNTVDTNLELTVSEQSDYLDETLSTDNFIIPSLFVDNSNMDQFLDEFIIQNVFVETAISEQNLENIFINSLFVEDLLLDDYIDESFIENIIL